MMVSKHQKRISGPLLDRIDIFVDVPRLEYEKLADDRVGEKAESVRARVEKAREVQRQRFAGTRLTCNNEMTPVEVRQFCPVDSAAQRLLRAAMKQMPLSARAFHRVLKPRPEPAERVSRTIADHWQSRGRVAVIPARPNPATLQLARTRLWPRGYSIGHLVSW